jgi:uncharacterized protein (TIGR03435 family)
MMPKSIVGLLFLATAFAQTRPAFEVASVKPAEPITAVMGKVAMRMGMTMDGGRVDINMLSLADLISRAYRLKSYQVSGPDWMSSERYEIHAKLPEGASQDQVPEMLQTLLEERFKIALHRDNKEHAVYALVVGKGGPKMEEAEPDPPAGTDGAKSGQVTTFGGGGGGGGGNAVTYRATAGGGDGAKGMVVTRGSDGKTSIGSDSAIHLDTKMTMTALAEFLSRFMDKPVLDSTELKGTYKVALDVPLQDLIRAKGVNVVTVGGGPGDLHGAGDGASDPSGSSLFGVVQKLGLKLEPRKLPMEVLVIDHAEKVPTEN